MGCPIIRTTVCSSQKMSGQLRAFSISTKPVLFFKFEDVLQSIVIPQDNFAQPQRIDGNAIFFEPEIRLYFSKDSSINLFSIIDHCLLAAEAVASVFWFLVLHVGLLPCLNG